MNEGKEVKIVQKTMELESAELASVLFGSHDRHLRIIRTSLGVQISSRNGLLRIDGEEARVRKAVEVFERLIEIVHARGVLDGDVVDEVVRAVECDRPGGPVAGSAIEVSIRGVSARPKTEGQAGYV
ncbi:MAG: hypothetical protein V3V94_02575, partial [Candidatus Brocadiales bacterium]